VLGCLARTKLFLPAERQTLGITSENSPVMDEETGALTSYISDSSVYEEVFESTSIPSKETVKAGVVAHHLLAAKLIASFYAGIDITTIKTVVVVSPDHFQKITPPTLAVTTPFFWRTPFGVVEANKDLTMKLAGLEKVQVQTVLFYNEHGISLHPPFIRYYLPQAKIVPLVLSQVGSFEYYQMLGKTVADTLNPSETLVIISSDFSHNETKAGSEAKDRKSIEWLTSMDVDAINKITCDCRQCFAFLLGYLEDEQTTFHLQNNKNSTDFGGEDKDVTSYVSGYFVKE